MTYLDIKNILETAFDEPLSIQAIENTTPKGLLVPAEKLHQVCLFLRDHDKTYFDSLSCVTAIDNGPEAATMEVNYNLYSIPFDIHLLLRVVVARNNEGEELPAVPTVSDIWRTAEWHEREAYDLMGIRFEGHPDLRRILLAADWVGHPLRKDYQTQEYYHGIKVDYQTDSE